VPTSYAFTNVTQNHSILASFAPDNDAPDAPVALSPANNDMVSLLPVLQTAEFYDPDNGDSHLKTQWQIFDQLSDDCVFDVETPTSLTALTVPRLILDENTAYYWKARFFDNHGTPSQWSVPAVFSTDFNSDDLNGDGIPDLQELKEPTDMDGDGTPDDQQNDIKCAVSALKVPRPLSPLTRLYPRTPAIYWQDLIPWLNPKRCPLV
jgi:hypothetical protein